MEELLTVVAAALTAAGLEAAVALPAGALNGLTAARAAVGVSSARRGKTTYLGTAAVAGSQQEVYGQTVEAELYIDVYAPTALGGGACTAAADLACRTLLEGVEGFTVTTVELGRCGFDGEANCFRCPVTLRLNGWLYAARAEDTAFLSFSLRGNLA